MHLHLFLRTPMHPALIPKRTHAPYFNSYTHPCTRFYNYTHHPALIPMRTHAGPFYAYPCTPFYFFLKKAIYKCAGFVFCFLCCLNGRRAGHNHQGPALPSLSVYFRFGLTAACEWPSSVIRHFLLLLLYTFS